MVNVVHDSGTVADFRLGSLNKALDVLEAFTPEAPELSLAELAGAVGISKPTVRRILQNLEARRYVRQDPLTRRYRLGLKTWEVGVVATGGGDLGATLRPSLRRLSVATGEQVTVWLYEAGEVVCIDRVESSHRVRSHTSLGTREPAHLLASGRCLLAHQDIEEIDRFVRALTAARGGAQRLHERLERVRLAGFEVSRGDRWPDVSAVGAPVLDHIGVAVAAVSVSGPSTRFDEGRLADIVERVTTAVGEASRQLGYSGSEENRIRDSSRGGSLRSTPR